MLDGKRVVVVGASAGIGRAFALHAAREGARLIAVARRADRLRELAEEAGTGVAVGARGTRAEHRRRLAGPLAGGLIGAGAYDFLIRPFLPRATD